jgi:hypothetical protein
MTGLALAMVVTAAVIVGTAAVVAVGLLIDRSAARHERGGAANGGGR